MAKIKVDNNINGDTPELQDTSSKRPLKAIIKKMELIAAEDLPEQFENRDNDRWQATVQLGEDENALYQWMPNKTAMKAIMGVHGDESDNWIGKEIGIYLVEQNVGGVMKKVAYAIAK